MHNEDDKEELYRRLDQTRRILREPLYPLTRERLRELASEIEKQLASAEAY